MEEVRNLHRWSAQHWLQAMGFGLSWDTYCFEDLIPDEMDGTRWLGWF